VQPARAGLGAHGVQEAGGLVDHDVVRGAELVVHLVDRERERWRERDRDRQRHRERQRQRDGGRETEREREKEREAYGQ
jgi:hypothetical protein